MPQDRPEPKGPQVEAAKVVQSKGTNGFDLSFFLRGENQAISKGILILMTPFHSHSRRVAWNSVFTCPFAILMVCERT